MLPYEILGQFIIFTAWMIGIPGFTILLSALYISVKGKKPDVKEVVLFLLLSICIMIVLQVLGAEAAHQAIISGEFP